MKKFKLSNLVVVALVLLFGVLSFLYSNISNSVVVVSNDEEEHAEFDIYTVSDEEIFTLLSDIYDSRYEIIVEAVSVPEVVVAPKNDAEDPNKVIKENTEEKGEAKETTVEEARQTYETNETSFGIDVSTWQGDINWKKVKESGINFAMIRCGFRRLESGEIVMDNQFLDNIKGAIANNINVGVYFFSMAKNSTEALEEAKWVVNVIKDYDITYPVAIDSEIFNKYRLKGVSYSTLTNNVLVFCNYIKKQGYTPMIYSYANAFTKYFDTAKFDGQRIWLAQYNDEVTYKGNYHMWQYTSSGSVPGISGRVDMNVAYFSVTNDVTKASTVNGITNTGDLEVVEFIEMNMNTTLNKNVSLRSSPYTNLPNKAGSLDCDTNIVVTGMGDNFIRILYDDNTFYINDTNCFVMNLEEVLFDEIDLTVKVLEEVTLLSSPYNFLKDNIVGNCLVNDEIRVIGSNIDYVKVLIDNSEYYINDIDFYEILNDNIYNGSSGNSQS